MRMRRILIRTRRHWSGRGCFDYFPRHGVSLRLRLDFLSFQAHTVRTMNNVIPVVTLRDLNYTKSDKPTSIPAGTKLDLHFSDNLHFRAIFTHNGISRRLMVSNLHASVKATNGVKFHKMPSMNRLEKMSNDGVCTTVTGERVEPDGVAADGSASWLLVMGVI